MNYTLQLDKYELAILKSLVKKEYSKVTDLSKNMVGSDRGFKI